MALLDILKNKEEAETKKAPKAKKETKEKSETAPKENLANLAQAQSAVLIKKPLITEKATYLAESGKYVFIVPEGSNKIEIKKAIQDIYKVKVVKINVINVKSKEIGFGKNKGQTKGVRKAIVSVLPGQKIDILK
jgi:large subunit ribosomal protein L23